MSERDNGEMVVQQICGREVAQRRNQFAPRQISGCSKNDHDARVGLSHGWLILFIPGRRNIHGVTIVLPFSGTGSFIELAVRAEVLA